MHIISASPAQSSLSPLPLAWQLVSVSLASLISFRSWWERLYCSVRDWTFSSQSGVSTFQCQWKERTYLWNKDGATSQWIWYTWASWDSRCSLCGRFSWLGRGHWQRFDLECRRACAARSAWALSSTVPSGTSEWKPWQSCRSAGGSDMWTGPWCWIEVWLECYAPSRESPSLCRHCPR